MKEAASRINFEKKFDHSLAADLTHIIAGGEIIPPSQYRDAEMAAAATALPDPNDKGEWELWRPVSGRKKTNIRRIAEKDFGLKQLSYHQRVVDFMLGFRGWDHFPGKTPLEKAMAIMRLLFTEAEEAEPRLREAERPEEVAEIVDDMMQIALSLTREELDMLDNKGERHELGEEDGSRYGSYSPTSLYVASSMHKKYGWRKMIDISRLLDEFTKFQARRTVQHTPDMEGDDIRIRNMRGPNELSRSTSRMWALRRAARPYHSYLLATRQIRVRERVKREEKKQIIFVLKDGSGSISEGDKHWRMCGVVLNRLKAVIREDAVVYLSVFDVDIKDPASAETPEEARALIKRFQEKYNYTGGGTDIAAAIRSAYRWIEEKMEEGEMYARPEIVVLTDNDTSIEGLHKDEIPGVTVHGFAFESSNPSLITFCESTGGVGMNNF